MSATASASEGQKPQTPYRAEGPSWGIPPQIPWVTATQMKIPPYTIVLF